jgi:hypothetical protein
VVDAGLQACQEEADKAFLIGVSLPVLIAAGAITYILRSPAKELRESGRIFEDSSTGTVFEAPEGVQPARDKDVSCHMSRTQQTYTSINISSVRHKSSRTTSQL